MRPDWSMLPVELWATADLIGWCESKGHRCCVGQEIAKHQLDGLAVLTLGEACHQLPSLIFVSLIRGPPSREALSDHYCYSSARSSGGPRLCEMLDAELLFASSGAMPAELEALRADWLREVSPAGTQQPFPDRVDIPDARRCAHVSWRLQLLRSGSARSTRITRFNDCSLDAVARYYHAKTAHGSGVASRAARPSWSTQPAAIRRYYGALWVALPLPEPRPGPPAKLRELYTTVRASIRTRRAGLGSRSPRRMLSHLAWAASCRGLPARARPGTTSQTSARCCTTAWRSPLPTTTACREAAHDNPADGTWFCPGWIDARCSSRLASAQF